MKDVISALMDGELDGKRADEAIAALKDDAEARAAWRTYHLISDALRDTRPLSPGFAARVAGQLAAEPTVLAPARAKPQPRAWYAAAASLAAVALVGWLAFAPQPTPFAPIAQAPGAEGRAGVPRPVQVPLPRGTHDYLLAHQAFSPRVSLQGMAPYVLTVSDEVQESRK